MRIFIYLNLLTLAFFTIGIDYTQAEVLKAKSAESHFDYVDPKTGIKTKVGTAKAAVYISSYFIGELQSTAASRVFMSTADAGFNNLSFQGRGTVVGSADRNREPPAAAKYY